MCGIVGYSGPQNAIDIILEGLSRLEYRGYDSAGVCYKEKENLNVIKKEGKLQVLKDVLTPMELISNTGIGHTRWATHGAVNDFNAHPHGNEDVAIVHNGIIENATEIKESLEKEGYKFSSETDSETFLVLLTKNLKDESNMIKAIGKTFKTIKGNSAFVVLEKATNYVYAIKRAAPLVCGENATVGEGFVSSDPYALSGYSSKLYFPEDEVICMGGFSSEGITTGFYELDGSKSTRFKISEANVMHEVAQKGHFEHFMLKEIFEQPFLIRKHADRYMSENGLSFLESLSKFKPSFVHIAACGTAWHAGLLIRQFLEQFAGVRVNIELASEFRYRNPILKKDELGLFISQSGETADTLACQELCAKAGMKTYSIVNVEGSTLFRDCDENMLIQAGQEIGVASTKAFTLQVLTGYLLSQTLSIKFLNLKFFF